MIWVALENRVVFASFRPLKTCCRRPWSWKRKVRSWFSLFSVELLWFLNWWWKFFIKVDDTRSLVRSRDGAVCEVDGDRSCERMVAHLNGLRREVTEQDRAQLDYIMPLVQNGLNKTTKALSDCISVKDIVSSWYGRLLFLVSITIDISQYYFFDWSSSRFLQSLFITCIIYLTTVTFSVFFLGGSNPHSSLHPGSSWMTWTWDSGQTSGHCPLLAWGSCRWATDTQTLILVTSPTRDSYDELEHRDTHWDSAGLVSFIIKWKSCGWVTYT